MPLHRRGRVRASEGVLTADLARPRPWLGTRKHHPEAPVASGTSPKDGAAAPKAATKERTYTRNVGATCNVKGCTDPASRRGMCSGKELSPPRLSNRAVYVVSASGSLNAFEVPSG
jgi:hypothetical protein